MGTYPGIQSVADRAAYYGALRQSLLGDALAERLGENYRYDYRLDEGTFVFSNADGDRIAAKPSLIASIAPAPRTLRWGWSLPDMPGEDRLLIKRLGERFRISELITPEVAFAEDAGETDPLVEAKLLAELAGLVAIEAIREGCYFTVPNDDGSCTVFHLGGLDVPEPTMSDVSTRLPQLIAGGLPCRDARAAALGLAEHLGWLLNWQEADGSAAELHTPDGQRAEITFGQQGRLADFKAEPQ